MNGTNRLEQERRERILKRIESLQSLPSLPRVVSELLRVLAEDDFDMQELMELVQQDPSLTARVLKLANSAIYGRPRQIDSLSQALVLLGGEEIRRLLMTVSVMRSFEDSFDNGLLDREQFWFHSLGTAELATRIAAYFKLRFRGADYTAGLLHDMGKIILDQHFHAEYADCIDLAGRRGLPQFEAETKLLGLDHAAIGALLAERWDLPVSLRAAIAHHHDFRPPHEHRSLVACVRLANHLVKDSQMRILDESSHWQIEQDPAWAALVAEAEQTQEALLQIRDQIEAARGRVQALVASLQ
jgi:putative nucleotidyltransferase with HDIG domain